jgi:ferredoxin
MFELRIEPGGERLVASPDVPLLISALRAGVQLPSSCRNGTCRTCACQLVGGRIEYHIEWPGLSAEEKRDGLILPCVAHPLSDVVLRY